jgi:DUF1365 family protein
MRQPAPQLGGVEIAVAQRLVVTGLQKVDSCEMDRKEQGPVNVNLKTFYCFVPLNFLICHDHQCTLLCIVSLIKGTFYYLKIHYFSLILKGP